MAEIRGEMGNAQVGGRSLLIGTALAGLGVFAIDVATPLGVAEWVLYLIPIVLASRSHRTSAPFVAAAACTALLWLGFWLSPPGIPRLDAAINRTMGMVAGWAAAWLVVRRERAEQRLSHMSNTFGQLLDAAPVAVFTVDLENRIRSWNAAATALFGWGLDEVRGELPPIVASAQQARELRSLMERGDLLVHYELPHRRKDGSMVTVLASAAPLRDDAGRVAGGIVALLDVTELRRAETTAKASAARLADFLESTSDGFVALDRNWRYSYINSRGAQFFGRRPDELIGKHIWTEFPEGVGQPFHRAYERVMATGLAETLEDHYAPWDRWFANRIYPTADGIAIFYQEITARKRAEEQLRRLAAGQERAREAERTRIAREIHDELGQALTGLKMDLSWLRQQLPRKRDAVVERANAMLELLNSTVETVRRIAGELRPGVLDDLGLAAAVRWQAAEFARRSGIPATADTPDELAVDGDRATAAFRILQEALTNVARHAGASRVAISLKRQDETLVLAVHDNGRGIAPDETGDTSYGLLGMRERAEAWGGSVRVTPDPNGGTSVLVHLPLTPSTPMQS